MIENLPEETAILSDSVTFKAIHEGNCLLGI